MAIDDNQASREAVLARVRAALHRDGPDDEARAAAHAYLAARRQGPRPVLPADLLQRFLDRGADMSSTTERVGTLEAVPAAVGRYLDTLRRDAGIAVHAAAPVREQADAADAARLALSPSGDLALSPSGDATTALTGDTVVAPDAVAAHGVCWPEFAALDWRAAGVSVDVRPTIGQDALGVTGCFCAIAETGTLVFASSSETPSATFLLPETHIAIVRAAQIVGGMEDAFARLREERMEMPRAVNLVSGPSRTGDIEQTIVLGAHGPRRLHIVLVG
jgi:L-lactate dehydrogenase complex protein LldG